MYLLSCYENWECYGRFYPVSYLIKKVCAKNDQRKYILQTHGIKLLCADLWAI